MAKKDIKFPSYYELMSKNNKTSKKTITLRRTKKPVQITVDRKKWDEAMEDQKRAFATQIPLGLDEMLKLIIEGAKLQRATEIKKLLKSSNMNMIQKARFAFILGLIDGQVLKDLEQIHEIRNILAHNFDADFSHKEILKKVGKLSSAKDQEVTKTNSYKLYHDATGKCVDRTIDVLDKQEEQNS